MADYITDFRKKEDGTKYKIRVDYTTDYCKNRWILKDVIYVLPHKRTEIYLKAELERKYQYEHLDYNKKSAMVIKGLVDFCGIDEINKAFAEAYEHMKPPVFTEKDFDVNREEIER